MKPVLLLLPGMLNDARVWADVAAVLAPEVELRVGGLFAQASLVDMARDSWAALADVPVATPLLLAGFSMGGYVAMEMLARAPRTVQGLALIDTNTRPESAESAALREKTIAAMQSRFPAVVEGVLAFSTDPANQGDVPLMDRMRRMLLDVGAEVAIRQNRAIAARADHRARLAALALPVRVVCGRGDRVTPPELSQEAAALIPGAELIWIEGAGHMAPMERPTEVAAALRTLWRAAPQPV